MYIIKMHNGMNLTGCIFYVEATSAVSVNCVHSSLLYTLPRLKKGLPYYVEVYLKEGTEEDYVLVQVGTTVCSYTLQLVIMQTCVQLSCDTAAL